MEAAWRRAAVYLVCRDGDGRLLLTRFSMPGHANSGQWTMPGGGMEWGETPIDTAVRELEEETGLVARIGPLLGVFSRWFEPQETMSGEAGHVIALVYEVPDARGELRTSFDDGTTDACAWFTLDEVRGLRRADVVDFVLDLL